VKAATSPALDALVAADFERTARYAAPPLTTSQPNELVLAFVTADGPAGKPQRIKSVTGGGLTWRLARRSTDTWGTAEVWQAYAATPGTFSVQAVPEVGPYAGSVTVAAFLGAADTVAATATASGRSTVAATSLTTTQPGSLVWAAGHDWSLSQSRTPVSGQVVVRQFLARSVNDTFWLQRLEQPAGEPGSVTISASAARIGRWQLTAVEIPPR
jgi:hypothetical protein